MALFQVVKPYNSKVKVGDVIEMETLHRSLASHVVAVAGSRDNSDLTPVPPSDDDERPVKDPKPEKPLTKSQLEKLHEEALKIDAALFPA